MQAGVMLYSLQQFPQGRVPGTTTNRAADAVAATSAAATALVATPADVTQSMCVVRPGTAAALTTYGFANHLCTQQGLPIRDSRKCIDSTKGILAFYTAGKEAVSDNGRIEAQQFFHRVRPLEGRIKSHLPSKRTACGAPFPEPALA
jgi:hypothetical protein